MCMPFIGLRVTKLFSDKDKFSVCDAATEVANGAIGYDPDEPYGDNNQRFEGVSATVTCNANYGLDGHEAATCTSGQWTEATLGPCLPGMSDTLLHSTMYLHKHSVSFHINFLHMMVFL